mmetsp:Transcript_69304/g.225831  ORF Transcript_69304/g.225831 Transcript_69304/m.225831 type:complete len:333 (-) Transcript_69304:1051-2049(-)
MRPSRVRDLQERFPVDGLVEPCATSEELFEVNDPVAVEVQPLEHHGQVLDWHGGDLLNLLPVVGRLEQLQILISAQGAASVLVCGGEDATQILIQPGATILLGLFVVLGLGFPDGHHVVGHDARHHAQQGPRGADGEHHEDRLRTRNLGHERLELREELAVHDAEKREHGVADRGEHLLRLLGNLIGVVQQQAVPHHARGQDGEGVDCDQGQHEDPENTLHGLGHALRQNVQWPDSLHKLQQSQDPQEAQHPDEHHHQVAWTVIAMAGDAAQELSNPVRPRIQHAEGDNQEIHDVPHPVVRVTEETGAPTQPDARGGFEEEEHQHGLIHPPP